MKCCVCSQDRDPKTCIVIELTDAEKSAIRDMGQEPDVSYSYCKPCFRVLSDVEQGASLIRGVFQTELRAQGIAASEQLARKYYSFLIKRARRHGS